MVLNDIFSMHILTEQWMQSLIGTLLAQSVEHETLNLRVVGLSHMLGGCCFFLVLVFQFSLLLCALLQVTRQFSKEFNLFRSFRSQKSHTSSETKSRKLPGIKELDQPLTSASESTTTTETEDILTVAMESAATQTGSTESSRKSDPDLVLADNTPPADGDDCKSVCICLCMCVSSGVHLCMCVSPGARPCMHMPARGPTIINHTQ